MRSAAESSAPRDGQANDVARFRDREAKELSRSTANLSVKVLRICLGEAVRQRLLAVNPGVRVKLLKSTAESKRRANRTRGALANLYNRKTPSHYLTINNLVCIRQRKLTLLIGRRSLPPTQNPSIVRLACLFECSLLLRASFPRAAPLSFFGHDR